MAGHTPGLHVRLARVEDYSDVIALRKVNEGWDPLPQDAGRPWHPGGSSGV